MQSSASPTPALSHQIVVADPISDAGLAVFHELDWHVATPSAASLPAELERADALIVRSSTRVTAELLSAAPCLRVVGRAGVGVDNIDLDAATRRGVLVMNTPGSNAVSVAEHTFALLLSLARHVPQFNSAVHAGRWEKSSSGSELRRKTLGLIGLGRIGAEVARRARAFDMTVLAHDPYISEKAARDLGVDLVPLDTLLSRSDFISLHTALSPATEKLINSATLSRMKSGAHLINTARGELVDEPALAEALRSGRLAGAALDVFTVEPPKDSPLLGLSNVIATPHVAGSTAEAQEEVGVLIAQQVRDYLAGGVIRNAVNLPALSADEYRRIRPYLELAERLGSFVAQAAPGRFSRIRIRYAGELAEVGTHILRNSVLAGILNAVLEEPVNLINAASLAATRGLEVEEHTRRRELGFPNTLEVAVIVETALELSVEGTILHGASPRILRVDEIEVEAPLAGVLLFTRSRDVPGVIGQIGSILGSHGVNIATFALGRRTAAAGADALAIVRLDGDVPDSIVGPVSAIPAVVEARLLRLPA